MKNNAIHFAIGAGVILLPALISLLASPAAQTFLTKHPEEAVFVPLVSGLLAAFYDKIKPKIGA